MNVECKIQLVFMLVGAYVEAMIGVWFEGY